MKPQAPCGSESGYRRHLYEGTVTCRACCEAHAVHNANWRARSRVTTPINPLQYQAARIGLEPAEALEPGDRERLVAELHGLGWTDGQIAVLARMTTYTTARIRDGIGLRPNFGPRHTSAALMRTA